MGQAKTGRPGHDRVAYRYVAVCDVLGFKELLRTAGLDSVHKKYQVLREIVRELSKWEASAQLFSDTVLMYSSPLRRFAVRQEGQGRIAVDIPSFAMFRQAEAFMGWTAALVTSALDMGLPMRVGIAAGDCVISEREQTYLGQPIVDAYLVEESQDWIGMALHSSCLECFGDGATEGSFYRLLRYPVPIKADGAQISALNWTMDWPSVGVGRANIRETVEEYAQRYAGTRHEARWDHTLEFVKHAERRRADAG